MQVSVCLEFRGSFMGLKIDFEVDLHGDTSAGARSRLETIWSTKSWQGLRRVRVIHGTGEVLWKVVRLWCEEKGIEWTTESHNAGVTILHPGRRAVSAPAPPHRPLAQLSQVKISKPKKEPKPEKPVVKGAEPPPSENPKFKADKPVAKSPDKDLMAEEFARLAEEDERALRKQKHSRK
jgi:hypothetical protein